MNAELCGWATCLFVAADVIYISWSSAPGRDRVCLLMLPQETKQETLVAARTARQ